MGNFSQLEIAFSTVGSSGLVRRRRLPFQLIYLAGRWESDDAKGKGQGKRRQ